MKLSVVIVNYNVKYFLEQCLISVKKAIDGLDAEVLVVDNASSDGSVEFISAKFPWVQLIASNTNLGFSGGNNLALKLAKGDYLLLLNPDTVVAEDTFEKCVDFMDSHPDAGALGVRMIDGRGNFLPESKRGLPAPAVAFYKAFGLSAIFPKSRVFGRYHLGFLSEHETNEVDVLSGAYMWIRRSALEKTGLLDEDFFMYGEDIDLSYRIQKAGFKNYYFPATTIIHYKGESTRKGSLNYVKVFYNAMLIFAQKHFSGSQSGIFSLFIKTAIFFRGLLTVLANLFSSAYLFIIDGTLAFAGIYLIKQYWESTIKYSQHYYPNQFLFIVVPVYILIWIFSTYMTGAYDKPFRIRDLIRGIFFGTIAIAAVYAFLPNEWRFSRAIILLGAFWTTFEMLATRLIYHLIKFQSIAVEEEDERRTLVAGGAYESERAKKLLQLVSRGSEVVCTVEDATLLQNLTPVLGINEIIFCSADIDFKQIIRSITECGRSIQYKILNPLADVFVGSNSKNSAGDLYTFSHNINLAKPEYIRRKRLADIMVCLALIPLVPLNIFLISSFSGFLSNWANVLLGKKSWVGYSGNDITNLPSIKPGVITTAGQISGKATRFNVNSILNGLYAKHYSVTGDLKLILVHYKNLGR